MFSGFFIKSLVLNLFKVIIKSSIGPTGWTHCHLGELHGRDGERLDRGDGGGEGPGGEGVIDKISSC